MELPEHLHGFAHQAIIAEQNAAFARQEAAERGARWAVVLGLKPVQDGDMWWLSWGGLPEGVNAFAKTPEACIEAFDKAMTTVVSRPRDTRGVEYVQASESRDWPGNYRQHLAAHFDRALSAAEGTPIISAYVDTFIIGYLTSSLSADQQIDIDERIIALRDRTP